MSATFFVQPLDLVKTRMQMSGMCSFDSYEYKYLDLFWCICFRTTGAEGVAREHKTSFHAVFNIVKKEGVFGVYNGLENIIASLPNCGIEIKCIMLYLINRLSAGLMRQATYTTTRLGVYTTLFEKFKG